MPHIPNTIKKTTFIKESPIFSLAKSQESKYYKVLNTEIPLPIQPMT